MFNYIDFTLAKIVTVLSSCKRKRGRFPFWKKGKGDASLFRKGKKKEKGTLPFLKKRKRGRFPF